MIEDVLAAFFPLNKTVVCCFLTTLNQQFRAQNVSVPGKPFETDLVKPLKELVAYALTDAATQESVFTKENRFIIGATLLLSVRLMLMGNDEEDAGYRLTTNALRQLQVAVTNIPPGFVAWHAFYTEVMNRLTAIRPDMSLAAYNTAKEQDETTTARETAFLVTMAVMFDETSTRISAIAMRSVSAPYDESDQAVVIIPRDKRTVMFQWPLKLEDISLTPGPLAERLIIYEHDRYFTVDSPPKYHCSICGAQQPRLCYKTDMYASVPDAVLLSKDKDLTAANISKKTYCILRCNAEGCRDLADCLLTIVLLAGRAHIKANTGVNKPPVFWLCNQCNALVLQTKKCGRCRCDMYCSKVHQADGWSTHQKICANLSKFFRLLGPVDAQPFIEIMMGKRLHMFPARGTPLPAPPPPPPPAPLPPPPPPSDEADDVDLFAID